MQLLCAAGLVLGVCVLLPISIGELSGDLLKVAVLFGAGYIVCAALLLWRERRTGGLGLQTLLGALALGYAPSLLFLSLARWNLERHVLIPELAAGTVLACLTVYLRRFPVARVATLGAAAAIGLLLPVSGINKPKPHQSIRTWRLNSALYALKVTEYRTLIGSSRVTGGAVATFRDRYLVANGAGDIYLVGRGGSDDALAAQRLPYRIPLNSREFEDAVGKQVDAANFRTADLLVQDLGDRIRVFATHHFWKTAQQCFVMRVSMLEGDAEHFMRGSPGDLAWKTIFESMPCVRLNTAGGLSHFGGIQIGGRMALVSPHELLVAVGDHELDGVNASESFPQDKGNSYGKTVLVDLTDFSNQIFSLGHRNPQGLYADGFGAIWLTEHGPQGGDELNLIERGANYGWPLVTYGTQYGEHFWPGGTIPGSHVGFAEPFYSWVPSIGVSSLLVVHGPHFKLWDRDLLVSSLKDQALYRARVRDARVVMIERIPFGRRIRDIAEGTDGRLVLWSDSGALLEIETDTEVGGGEELFQVCTGCHAIGDGFSHGIGPDLRHIVNRPTASAAGVRYTAALRQLGGTWTRARLDEFLKNPQAFAPGTAMRFPGLAAAGDRKLLIEFLASGSNQHPPPDD